MKEISDWTSKWKRQYPNDMSAWDAQYPDIDREYVTFYPCDIQYLDPEEILLDQEVGEKMHFYIHIPFCEYLCPFCFFNKYLFETKKVATYLEALKKEITWYSEKPFLQNQQGISVYFGGGTPAILSSRQLLDVLQHIKEYFSIAENAEITVEASPLSINEASARRIRDGGINRISIGVQSFNDEHLQGLHLHHNAEYCIDLVKSIQDLGLNVGIDLMYRLPDQTLFDWQRDLSVAVDLGVDTVSCYSLELPPHVKGEVFGQFVFPNLQEDVKMYYLTTDYLKEHGYHQYTIADFALPGKASLYVGQCWKAPQHEYIAFGAGAHSFVGGYVFYNIASLKYYLECINNSQVPILFGKKLTREEILSRYFVLGLKTLAVDTEIFEQLYNVKAEKAYGETIADLKQKGLIESEKTLLKLTRKGLVYVDNVSKAFYTPNNVGKSQPIGILLQDARPEDFISQTM